MQENTHNTEGHAAGAAGGDPHAFAALVERVRGRLEVWISLRLGPALRARVSEEDVLQETLLEAHRSLADFSDTGPGSFRRWIFSVAENRIRDLNKFHSRQRRDMARDQAKAQRTAEETTLLERLAAGRTSPASHAHRAEMVGRLVRRIEELEEPLRDVVVQRAIEERTVREIAESLGKPATTVQALFARGLKSLRDELRPDHWS